MILLDTDGHTDAMRKSRDCPPRSSEPPDTEDRTPSPDPPDVAAEKNKNEAEEAYNTLIKMGGRSTGPIRLTPPWIKVYHDGELCYRYTGPVERLFYDPRWSFRPGPRHYLTEAEYIAGHWGKERIRCEEELRRWQDFRDSQQRARERDPEKAREEDMERQRYSHDPHLTASLNKLEDWKEYQGYFQRRINGCKKQMEALRRAVEALERGEDRQVVWSKVYKGPCRGRPSGYMRESIERHLECLAGEEKRLEWVKKQLPAVLSECAASLMEVPASCREMQERSEIEAKQVYKALMETGGRPSRPIRSVPDIYDTKNTDEHLHVLCHWQDEYSQFEEELREWKKFLDYRQKKETDGRTEVQLEEQQPAETMTQVDLWKEYRAYEQVEVDNAKQWVEFWQRQVKYFQDTENRLSLEGNTNTAIRMHSEAEDMQSHAEDARKQVKPAEMRLEWVEQQLSALLAESAISSAEVSTSGHPEAQAITPQRASRSGQLKGLGSDRSGRSALRSNQNPDNNNKKRASPKSALGPIHSSKVSKAAGRKTHRSQRPSKIPAEHNDGQNQGLNTTVSPSLPAAIAPRRSSRLFNNEQRPGGLESQFSCGSG